MIQLDITIADIDLEIFIEDWQLEDETHVPTIGYIMVSFPSCCTPNQLESISETEKCLFDEIFEDYEAIEKFQVEVDKLHDEMELESLIN